MLKLKNIFSAFIGTVMAANTLMTVPFSSFADNETAKYELILSSSESKFYDDEDTLTYFYVETDYEGEKITLINADDMTEYDMVDDGKFSVSGDDLPYDGVYSAKLELDTSGTSYDNVKVLSFYAVTEDGSKSDTITIKIVKRFTELQLKEMRAVNEKILGMKSSDEYKTADYDTKSLMLKEALTAISMYGTEEYNYSLIDAESISLSKNGEFYLFRYYFGFPSQFNIEDLTQYQYEQGDVNRDGKVNAEDVVLMQKYIAASGALKEELSVLDINCDGVFNVFDVVKLKRIILK